MSKDPNVMPAGSMPPEPEGDNTDSKATDSGSAGDKASKSGDDKILGKFKSTDEIAAAYTELEKKLSQQGQELTQLRKAPPATQDQAPAADAPDYEGQRKELLEKIDTGDVSLAEGLAALDALTREATQMDMEAKFADYDQKRSANEMYDNFVSENPLFIELDQAGKLDEAIQQNPIHDKVSAFYEIKATIDAESAFTKGQEEALRIAKGADGTRSVLSNPGAETREAPVPKKGAGNAEVVQGMMGALAAARSQ